MLVRFTVIVCIKRLKIHENQVTHNNVRDIRSNQKRKQNPNRSSRHIDGVFFFYVKRYNRIVPLIHTHRNQKQRNNDRRPDSFHSSQKKMKFNRMTMTSFKCWLNLQSCRYWIFVLYFVLLTVIDFKYTVDGLSTTNDRGN